MARIRTIKPEFWTDSTMVRLPVIARLFFVGLWNFADDYGFIWDEPDRIKLQIFPADPVDTSGLIDLLVAAERLERHVTDDGRVFLKIRNWQHQKVSHPAQPTFPPGRKATIPNAVRRAIAQKYGCSAGESVDANCHYCGAPGTIHWWKLSNGRPSSWVTFSDLELDHFAAESVGGDTHAENIVLACESCNRTKGTRHGVEFLVSKLPTQPQPSGVLQRAPEPSGLSGSGTEGIGNRAERRGDPLRSESNGQSPAAASPASSFDRFLDAFYRRSTPERRQEVQHQLEATLTPEGARFRRGEFIRARSPEHLEKCILATVREGVRDHDKAIVVVLKKLTDPELDTAGRTVTEAESARTRAEIADEERYQAELAAAVARWAKENPDEYSKLERRAERQIPGHATDAFARIARAALINPEVAKRIHFPPLEKWRADRLRNAKAESAPEAHEHPATTSSP